MCDAPSPYPQPAPVPTPSQKLAGLTPWSAGSTSQIFKTVIKRPQLVQIYMNDQLHTNAPDVENQFLAELRAYQTAGPHSNIAAMLGCIEGVGMVLEQVDGDTLFERVLRRNAPPGARWGGEEAQSPIRVNTKLKIEWFNQLLEALCHVHKHGLSHGDINSLNVLITTPTAHPPNVVKLIDFGRSTFYAPPGSPAHIPPSEVPHPPAHPFAAPEILRGGKYIDKKSYKKLPVDGRLADAYSLGVLLWCMDEERLIEIDQMAQRKEDVVLYQARDDDEDGGDEADDESSEDSAMSPAVGRALGLSISTSGEGGNLSSGVVDEGYFSGNNDGKSKRRDLKMMVPRQRRRLFSKLIRGYMKRWEERTRIDISQKMPVPASPDASPAVLTLAA